MTTLARPSFDSANSRWRWLASAFIAGAALATFTSRPASGRTGPTRDSHSKAAAFCNIISFTDWPAAAFQSADAPLVVGILGEGPIGALLAEFLENETWHGRPIVLRSLTSSAHVRTCHVLFVTASEHLLWLSVSSAFARLPLLTVSDADDFARTGGMVQLTSDGDKPHVTINLKVVKVAGLSLSSKLLRLAEVIENRDP